MKSDEITWIRNGVISFVCEAMNKANACLKSVKIQSKHSYQLYQFMSCLRKPENIFFLTCDAYGVLPPVSLLTDEQAMYYFISGYTAKIAGTETGINEPKATFSTCFGAPFLPLSPLKYASMLREKIKQYKIPVWLINTGWTGGSYGTGKRINLKNTRSIIHAILEKKLEGIHYTKEDVFGLNIPTACPGVSSDLLTPKNTWSSKEDYLKTAMALSEKFARNFKQYDFSKNEDVAVKGSRLFTPHH